MTPSPTPAPMVVPPMPISTVVESIVLQDIVYSIEDVDDKVTRDTLHFELDDRVSRGIHYTLHFELDDRLIE